MCRISGKNLIQVKSLSYHWSQQLWQFILQKQLQFKEEIPIEVQKEIQEEF